MPEMRNKGLIIFPLLLAVTACTGNSDSSMHRISCNPPANLADLSGKYTSEMIAISDHGKKTGSSTLDIKVDEIGVISGKYSWKASDGFGNKINGQKVQEDSENVIGVFDPRDCEIGLAETAENGSFRGRLLSDGKIDLILIEPGVHPAAKLFSFQKLSES